MEVNIYYQRHRERMEIDMMEGQKWIVILGMLWLACHNPEINWRTWKVKIIRCSKKCGKQWSVMGIQTLTILFFFSFIFYFF